MRHLAAQVRDRRRQAGLTQAALAARSGTSRVTIARFEAGAAQDVRLGTLNRLCEAVGLELTVLAPGCVQALEIRLARERERGRRLEARRRHAALAVRLLGVSAREAGTLIARARENVDRWQRNGLCSAHYISRWRRRLAGSRMKVAQALTSDDRWTDALLQNTPWSFALAPAAS